MAAGLRRFLARLSVDHQLLAQFVRSPIEVLDGSDLTDDERKALLSRNQWRIQQAVADEPSEPAGVPRPAGPPS